MKYSTIIAVIASFILLTGSSAWSGDKKQPVDYQVLAEKTKWEWSAAAASFEKSKAAMPKAYTAEANFQPNVSFGTIQIQKDGKKLFSWEGHSESVFVVLGDFLYYTDLSPHANGCTLIAVDLPAGKRLWSTRLKGLGPIPHTRYRNQVNLASFDMETLRVFGLESAGAYVEFLDRRTGKIVGHRQIKTEELKPAK